MRASNHQKAYSNTLPVDWLCQRMAALPNCPFVATSSAVVTVTSEVPPVGGSPQLLSSEETKIV